MRDHSVCFSTGFPHTLRAFIVTDISLVRWDIADRLGEAGFAVVEGACGKDTLSSIQPDDHFDLIFLDIRAPWGPWRNRFGA